MPTDFASTAARSLQELACKFREGASAYPNFEAALLVGADEQARLQINYVGVHVFRTRQVRLLVNLAEHTMTWLLDDNYTRGKAAYERFADLARLAVVLLADLGVISPIDVPWDEKDPYFHEGLRTHFVKYWTWLVYERAREHVPDSLLRCYESSSVEHVPLAAAVCRTLSLGIFEASAVVIERFLDRAVCDHEPAAASEASKATAKAAKRGQAVASEALPMELRDPEAHAGRPQRMRQLDSASLIISTVQAFADRGEWGKTSNEIIRISGVPRSTYYELAKKHKQVRNNLRWYKSQTLGRGPVYVDDL